MDDGSAESQNKFKDKQVEKMSLLNYNNSHRI
jgi:hypothetical protein